MNNKVFVGLSLAALLTAFVPNLSGTGSAHAEEKKLFDPIPKKATSVPYWYMYYETGDIKKEEYTYEHKLQVSNDTMLYNLDGQPEYAWISPQTVTYSEAHRIYGNIMDAVYIVDTWFGKKQIYRKDVNEKNENFYEYEINRPKSLSNGEVFKEVSNQNIVPLYNAPREDGPVVGSIAPQKLNITAVSLADGEWFGPYADSVEHRYVKGFIGIETWLGEKWVSVNDLQGEKIEKDVYLTDATEVVELLDYPGHYTNSATAGNPKITPQKVYAIQRVGDYTQIKTWLGDKWVKSKTYVAADMLNDGVLTFEEGYVGWKGDVKYYNSPDSVDVATGPINNFPAPVIKAKIVYTKNDGEVWYLSEDDKWVKQSDVEVGKKLNGLFAIKETKTLYKKNLDKTQYTVDPQNVSAKYAVGGWYLIDTWLGEMWVKMY
ncbi:hypothetical protein bcgnr5390_11960 [Bacillus luti]|nr:hypothetical protein BC2903_28940 [Bacillus cereus]